MRQQSDAENAMSLDEQAISLTTGTARTERDMLVAIQNGDLPRFIARVGPSDNFSRGTLDVSIMSHGGHFDMEPIMQL